jgi:hypothetical protein
MRLLRPSDAGPVGVFEIAEGESLALHYTPYKARKRSEKKGPACTNVWNSPRSPHGST